MVSGTSGPDGERELATPHVGREPKLDPTAERPGVDVLVGLPLGGLLSLAIAGCAAVLLLPQLLAVSALSQVVLPVAIGGG